jgi:hypothetical protein
VCLVDLNNAPQGFPVRCDHRSTQLVEHRPNRFILVQAQLPLELECRHSGSVGCHKVRGPKPVGQRRPGTVENRPGGHGGLQTTRYALHQVTTGEIEAFGPSAPGTTVAIRPAGGYQVRPARSFVKEAALNSGRVWGKCLSG